MPRFNDERVTAFGYTAESVAKEKKMIETRPAVGIIVRFLRSLLLPTTFASVLFSFGLSCCTRAICAACAIGEGFTQMAQRAQKVCYAGIWFFCAICGRSAQMAQVVCFAGTWPFYAFCEL